MHSDEQMRKKEMARAEAFHHMHRSAVDGEHHDMPRHEEMYRGNGYERKMEEGK